MSDDKLAGGVYGVGAEIKNVSVEAVVGGLSRLRGPWAEAVEGELCLGQKLVP